MLSAHGVVIGTAMDLVFQMVSPSEKGRLCATAEKLNTIPGVAVWCDAITH